MSRLYLHSLIVALALGAMVASAAPVTLIEVVGAIVLVLLAVALLLWWRRP